MQTIAHAQGRIIRHASVFEYQYHITDHLGNIRLTFTASPELNEFNASASSAMAEEEESQFMKLSETRAVVHPSVNHTADGSPEVLRLNGGRGIKDGPATMVNVMPGDTVRMRVFAKYLDLRKYNGNVAASAVLAMLANPGAAVSLGESVIAEGVSSGALGSAAGGMLLPADKAAPKAYLNYLLFDKNMKEVGRGAVQVSELASVTEKSIDAPHEELNMEVIAPQEGYLFSYLSHEENSNVEVYFDDFALTLAGGPIVQVDDFYPYGMAFNHEATDNAVLNRYLYQGKEKLSDDTDWYDFHARLYSPALGRFMGVDPQGQFANPYNGMGNNPVMYVDPDGEIAFLAIVGIVAAISGGTNLAANWKNVNNFSDGLYYFGVGAAVGAGATVGGAALAPVIGTGAIAGAAFGAASGFTVGFANTAYATGGNWGTALSAGGWGALYGGVGGAVVGGTIAGIRGNNVWTGAARTPGTSAFSFKDIAGGANSPSWNFKDAENIFTRNFWKYGYNPKLRIEAGPAEISPNQPKNGWDRNYSSNSNSTHNGRVVTNPDGSQVKIEIPSNYTVRIADNGNGYVYQAPGAQGNANMIRIMGPTNYAPNGYAVFYNNYGQPYNPANGITLSRTNWHFLFK